MRKVVAMRKVAAPRDCEIDRERSGAEGFVLGGGLSTRMGQNKAMLRVAGQSLLELALKKLSAVPLATNPRVAGGGFEMTSPAEVIFDRQPGCGPLSGMEAALEASHQSLNIFLPVDMPLVPPQFLTWMLQRARITGALATVPRIYGRPQPLCAIYHRELLLPISAALAAGIYKVMAVVGAEYDGRCSIDSFDVEMVAASDARVAAFSRLPLYRWFHNCNTPEDMAGVEDALVWLQ
jgi:molybdenum cofactor guanylyltransferase